MKWIKIMPIKSYFNYAIIAGHALVNDEVQGLYELAGSNEIVRMKILEYFNYMASGYYKDIDIEYDENVPILGIKEINEKIYGKRMKTVTKVGLRIFREHKMKKESVTNLIFNRTISGFIRLYKMCKENKVKNNLFEQEILKNLRTGPRLQYAVLSYLYKHEYSNPLVFALIAEVPRINLPECILANYNSLLLTATSEVERRIGLLEREKEKIAEGLPINLRLKDFKLDHKVFVIDTVAKVQIDLEAFLNNGEDDWIGLDAEWNQSDCGMAGELCLIQLSNRNVTMILDVVALNQVLDEDAWIVICKMIFKGKKKVVGKYILNVVKL